MLEMAAVVCSSADINIHYPEWVHISYRMKQAMGPPHIRRVVNILVYS